MTLLARGAALILIAISLLSCVTSQPALQLADEYYNLGNEWFDLRKFDKAAAAYQKALSWNPALNIASLNLARTKAELGDAAGALAILGPLAQADPDNLVLAQYRAWITGRKDGLAAAAPLYAELARRLPGDAATQYNAGVSLRAAERQEEALAAFRQWKVLDGKSWQGLAALAEILDAMGSAEGADAWLDAASVLPENDTKRFDPLFNRARDLETAQRYGDASEAWAAALALPAVPGQKRGEALFRRGSLLLLEIEDYQPGSAALVEAWKAGYKTPEAWKALLDNPRLKFSVKLQADLKLAGVTP